MGADRALFSAEWRGREEAQAQQAGNRECDIVCGEKRLPMAHAAAGFSAVADRVRPFSALELARRVGASAGRVEPATSHPGKKGPGPATALLTPKASRRQDGRSQ